MEDKIDIFDIGRDDYDINIDEIEGMDYLDSSFDDDFNNYNYDFLLQLNLIAYNNLGIIRDEYWEDNIKKIVKKKDLSKLIKEHIKLIKNELYQRDSDRRVLDLHDGTGTQKINPLYLNFYLNSESKIPFNKDYIDISGLIKGSKKFTIKQLKKMADEIGEIEYTDDWERDDYIEAIIKELNNLDILTKEYIIEKEKKLKEKEKKLKEKEKKLKEKGKKLKEKEKKLKEIK